MQFKYCISYDSSVLDGSAWLTKVQLQDEIIEDISDRNYFEYITTMDRLVAHPYSYRAKDFIMKNRRTLSFKENSDPVAIPIVGEDGRSYVTIHSQYLPANIYDTYSSAFRGNKIFTHFPTLTGCIRKSAVAEVTTISPGTGKIEINGRDISFFKYDQPRQEVRDNYVNYDEIPWIWIAPELSSRTEFVDVFHNHSNRTIKNIIWNIILHRRRGRKLQTIILILDDVNLSQSWLRFIRLMANCLKSMSATATSSTCLRKK